MKAWPVFFIFAILWFGDTQSDARQISLTSEQKTKLETAQIVLVEVLALTEKGRYDPQPLIATVKERFEAIGYRVTTERSQPHDVEVKVKCEEQKTLAGISASGGDSDLADAPDRLWKGPACLLTYFLQQNDFQWKKEVRTTFADARQAAQEAQVDDAGKYAMDHLNQRLAEFDFPVLLSAEWGQIDRLLKLLDNPNTPKLRKVKILSVLSDAHAEEALPQLTKLLESTDLQEEAINALSGAGVESIPLLIDLFQTSRQSNLRAEAAKALGIVASKSGDPRTIPPLAHYVSEVLPHIKTSEDINFPLLTEVVWAIGKLRWGPSLKPISELQDKVWLIHDNSKEMAELREATSWAYKAIALQDAAMLQTY